MPDMGANKRSAGGLGWFDLALEIREHIIEDVFRLILDKCHTDQQAQSALRALANVSYKFSQEDLQRPLRMAMERLWTFRLGQLSKSRRAVEDIKLIIVEHSLEIDFPGPWVRFDEWKEGLCNGAECGICSLLRPMVDVYTAAAQLADRSHRQWQTMAEFYEYVGTRHAMHDYDEEHKTIGEQQK